jgi:hypothetical protein
VGSFVAGIAALIFCVSVLVCLEWMWLAIYRRQSFWVLVVTPFGLGLLFYLLADGLFSAQPVRELARIPATALQSRALPSPERGTTGGGREDLKSYVQQWLDDRGDEIAPNNGAGDRRPYPVFIVAAPGGGIRSAYWTAGVLGALQDKNHSFARHILAISGVSGGAVGAGIFAALVKSECSLSSAGTTTSKSKLGCRESAARILANDFLAPTVYSMLSRDLATGVLPLPDRATALEQALESGWRSVMNTDMLSQPFNAMWERDSRSSIPGLFFNLTNAGSGERLVLGPASILPHEKAPGEKSALLAQQMLEAKVFRLSTAMVLGARFPYISPEGLVADDATPDVKPRKLRLVDGGLSDNSGFETILNILEAVAVAKPPSNIRVYVLNIENSPLPTDELDRIGPFRAPVMLFTRMVAGLTEKSKIELRQQMRKIKNTAVLDEVRPAAGKSVFLLGWTLPGAVRTDMNDQIKAALTHEPGALDCIVAELAVAGTRPENPATALSPDSHCLPVVQRP